MTLLGYSTQRHNALAALTALVFCLSPKSAEGQEGDPAPKVQAEEKPSPDAVEPQATDDETESGSDSETDNTTGDKPGSESDAPTKPESLPAKERGGLDLGEDSEDDDSIELDDDGDPDGKSQPQKNPAEKKPPATKKPAPPPPPKIDYSKLPWTYHQKRIDLGVSVRGQWVTDPAFDLFQAKNAHPAFGAHGAYAFFASRPLSVAATLHYSAFSAEGEARTLPSYLEVHRLLAGGEARYHFAPYVYAYGRVGLGAWLTRSRLGGSDNQLEQDGAGLSGSLALGSAVRIAGSPDGRTRAVRVHVFAEGALGYDTPFKLDYEVSEGGALRPAPVGLGSLSLGGPQIALGAMVSY